MSNVSTIVKWLMIGLVAVLAFIFFRKCSKQAEVKPAVEKIVRDTIYTSGKDSIIYVPKPVKVIYRTTDTIFTDLPGIVIDTCSSQLVGKYYAKRFYDTTLSVSHGTLQLKDTVTQNRITGRSVVLNQSIPVVKETVTLEAKKRLVLYWGITALANKGNLPYGSGFTLDLKFTNDAMFGVGALFTKDDNLMYQGTLRFPIRLRK